MTKKTHPEILSHFQAWVNNPAITETLGSHASAVRGIAGELVHQYNQLEKNSKTRPTVAIYGPSQAGKSYLTAKICECADGWVNIRVDKDYDFLKSINPAGGRESTALVTRITTKQADNEGSFRQTVRANLLSLPDLVCIFTNVYLNDVKHNFDINREGVANRIVEVCGQDVLDNVHNPDNSIDPSMIELQRILKHLPLDPRPYVDLLRLPIGTLGAKSAHELTQLFSCFWGDILELSHLFSHLCEHLIKLDFACSLLLPVTAFVPREQSIIDVAVLSKLQDQEFYRDNSVNITIKDTEVVSLPRPVLCALVSEVEFYLHDPKSALLSSVDILDFPGARSRIRRDLGQYDEGGIDKLFLRGKIAHLFESASVRDEIDTLLLCVKPGPMDVAELPSTLDRWLQTVADEQVTKRLFVIATQFDLHFPDAAGQNKGDKERFENAIFSALLEPFSLNEESWLSKSRFQNVYPIRNPNYPYDGFFNYDKEGKEFEVRIDKAERIRELQHAFNSAENIQAYVANFSLKWQSLMKPGDGGVHLLLDDLRRIDWFSLKSHRVALSQNNMLLQMASLIEPFAIYDDVNKKIDQEKEKFSKYFLLLQNLLEEKALANFVEAFTLDAHSLKSTVSSVVFSDDNDRLMQEGVSGIQVPAFLKGRVPESHDRADVSPREKFHARIIKALLIAIVEEVESNITSFDKKFASYQDAFLYLSSHATHMCQFEKIRAELILQASNWAVGLKLTDNLGPLCMLAARSFEKNLLGTSLDVVSNRQEVAAHIVTSSFSEMGPLPGNLLFFNSWMSHLAGLIEENVVNSVGEGRDLTLNLDLLNILSEIGDLTADLRA